ncbi:MAG TPA: class I SAM-dependent methyltransferase [Bryobacteraceae bacterium]
MRTEEISRQAKVSNAAETCVVCGTPVLDRVRVRLDSSQLRECSSCGTWVYFPRPQAAEQAAIHDTEDYFEHPYFELRRRSGEAQLRRCRQIIAHLTLDRGTDFFRGQRLLDIGCDTGLFLTTAAKEFGVQPIGVDVGARAVAVAARQGIEVYRASLETAPESLHELAAITAIDLIEHLSDPAAFLREIRKRLRPGGVVYLETPNIRSTVYAAGRVLSRMTGGWPAPLYQRLFPAQHIQYFTRSSLAALANACGLELARMGTRVLPWDDIAASGLVRAGMAGMQTLDRISGEQILIWAVLRRPA